MWYILYSWNCLYNGFVFVYSKWNYNDNNIFSFLIFNYFGSNYSVIFVLLKIEVGFTI